MKKTTLKLIGAEVYAYHGVGDAERELGGRYSFDVIYPIDASNAVADDELDETVDYTAVYEAARDVVVDTRRRLLEAIVDEITSVLIARFPRIIEATVRLRKLHPPIIGMIGSVEAERTISRGEVDR